MFIEMGGGGQKAMTVLLMREITNYGRQPRLIYCDVARGRVSSKTSLNLHSPTRLLSFYMSDTVCITLHYELLNRTYNGSTIRPP